MTDANFIQLKCVHVLLLDPIKENRVKVCSLIQLNIQGPDPLVIRKKKKEEETLVYLIA